MNFPPRCHISRGRCTVWGQLPGPIEEISVWESIRNPVIYPRNMSCKKQNMELEAHNVNALTSLITLADLEERKLMTWITAILSHQKYAVWSDMFLPQIQIATHMGKNSCNIRSPAHPSSTHTMANPPNTNGHGNWHQNLRVQQHWIEPVAKPQTEDLDDKRKCH